MIEADRIYIEQLESNNSCVFYNNVVIERFEGENNKFHTKIKKWIKTTIKNF